MCSETIEKRGTNKNRNILIIILATAIIAIVSTILIVIGISNITEPNGGGG